MSSSGHVDALAARFYNKIMCTFDLNLELTFDRSAIWVVAKELDQFLSFNFLLHHNMVVHEHNLDDVWLGDASDVTQAVFSLLGVFKDVDSVHAYHTQKLHVFFQREGYDSIFFSFFWNFEAFNLL